jgi:hypothetical protein
MKDCEQKRLQYKNYKRLHSEQQRVDNGCALSRRDKSTNRRAWTTSRKNIGSEQVRKDGAQKRLQYRK